MKVGDVWRRLVHPSNVQVHEARVVDTYRDTVHLEWEVGPLLYSVRGEAEDLRVDGWSPDVGP